MYLGRKVARFGCQANQGRMQLHRRALASTSASTSSVVVAEDTSDVSCASHVIVM